MANLLCGTALAGAGPNAPALQRNPVDHSSPMECICCSVPRSARHRFLTPGPWARTANKSTLLAFPRPAPGYPVAAPLLVGPVRPAPTPAALAEMFPQTSPAASASAPRPDQTSAAILESRS